MNNQLCRIKEDSVIEIKRIIGEDAWSALLPNTQTGIVTAEVCIRSFNDDPSGIDFSASIMPIMKGLETELVQHFYKPYLTFLKRNYTPEKYIEINQLNNRKQYYNQNVCSIRRRIITNEYGEISFLSENSSTAKEFTIGSYQYCVGIDSLSKNNIDKTAVEFYQRKVFLENSDEKDIIKWIFRTTESLESIRELRNGSAHAGRIQSLTDAKTVIDLLLKSQQLLISVSQPSINDRQF